MNENITPAARAKALLDDTTPGPWVADFSEEDNFAIKQPGQGWGQGHTFTGKTGDAHFIAAAPQLIQDLIEENIRLQEENEKLREGGLNITPEELAYLRRCANVLNRL